MKISNFNDEYLTLPLARMLKEEKTSLLMNNFNTNFLNADTDTNV